MSLSRLCLIAANEGFLHHEDAMQAHVHTRSTINIYWSMGEVWLRVKPSDVSSKCKNKTSIIAGKSESQN